MGAIFDVLPGSKMYTYGFVFCFLLNAVFDAFRAINQFGGMCQLFTQPASCQDFSLECVASKQLWKEILISLCSVGLIDWAGGGVYPPIRLS